MRVLFLTHRLPYAPNRGDRVRAYHLLRYLKEIADVDVLSLVHDDEEAAHADDLSGLSASVRVVRAPRFRNMARSLALLPTDRPTTHTMLDAPSLRAAVSAIVDAHPPDVVLAYCSGLAYLALEPLLNRVPLVLDMVDVDSAKWADLAATSGAPLSWIYGREARVLRRFEQIVAERAVATLVVTDRERDTLRGIAPHARIEVVTNGVDASALRSPNTPAGGANVVFCGVMNYAPNVEAAVWMAKDIWPLVRARRSDARLQLVGSHPSRAVLRLANETAGIVVTGWVNDVRQYLWNGAVAVAPLLTARGVQNKVLEAVASGLPAIVTPVVLSGLPLEVRPACIAAQSPAEFAKAVVSVLDQSPTERRMATDQIDFGALSWARTLARVDGILTDAAGSARHETSGLQP